MIEYDTLAGKLINVGGAKKGVAMSDCTPMLLVRKDKNDVWALDHVKIVLLAQWWSEYTTVCTEVENVSIRDAICDDQRYYVGN